MTDCDSFDVTDEFETSQAVNTLVNFDLDKLMEEIPDAEQAADTSQQPVVVADAQPLKLLRVVKEEFLEEQPQPNEGVEADLQRRPSVDQKAEDDLEQEGGRSRPSPIASDQDGNRLRTKRYRAGSRSVDKEVLKALLRKYHVYDATGTLMKGNRWKLVEEAYNKMVPAERRKTRSQLQSELSYLRRTEPRCLATSPPRHLAKLVDKVTSDEKTTDDEILETPANKKLMEQIKSATLGNGALEIEVEEEEEDGDDGSQLMDFNAIDFPDDDDDDLRRIDEGRPENGPKRVSNDQPEANQQPKRQRLEEPHIKQLQQKPDEGGKNMKQFQQAKKKPASNVDPKLLDQIRQDLQGKKKAAAARIEQVRSAAGGAKVVAAMDNNSLMKPPSSGYNYEGWRNYYRALTAKTNNELKSLQMAKMRKSVQMELEAAAKRLVASAGGAQSELQ